MRSKKELIWLSGDGGQASNSLAPVATEVRLDRAERIAPYLFLILTLITSLFLAWNMPPFMNADELAHVDRAEVVFPQRVGEGDQRLSGGPVEKGVYAVWDSFEALRFHSDDKVDAADYVRAAPERWRGDRNFTDFRSSSSYPPYFYLPAAVALDAGKAARLTIVQTLYLARVAQALAFAAIGFLALLLARRSRLYLFAVLLLPMTQALAGSITADSLLIATTALGVGALCRPMSEGRWASRRELFGAALCFALVAATKAPYVLLGFILLAVDSESRRDRRLAAAAVVGAMLAWQLISAATVQLPLTYDGTTDPGRQARYLLGHPLAIPVLAWETLRQRWQGYADQFVGVLGWLDTPLPRAYYILAWLGLGTAAAVSCARRRAEGWRAMPRTTALTALLIFGAVYAALYLVWSPVGGPVVEGVQGRYFLPIACLLALVLEGSGRLLPEGTERLRRIRLVFGAAVLAFPVISLLIVQRAVILRYYLD